MPHFRILICLTLLTITILPPAAPARRYPHVSSKPNIPAFSNVGRSGAKTKTINAAHPDSSNWENVCPVPPISSAAEYDVSCLWAHAKRKHKRALREDRRYKGGKADTAGLSKAEAGVKRQRKRNNTAAAAYNKATVPKFLKPAKGKWFAGQLTGTMTPPRLGCLF
jgi:hypothetical protein